MYLRPKVKNGAPTPEDSSPMSFRRVTSFSSSFLPRGHPALRRAFSGHRPFSPASPPWWSGHRFPPWPPRLPPPRPPARPIFSCRAPHPFNARPGGFRAAGVQPLHSSVRLMMERPGREPPSKRRKSGEQQQQEEEESVEEKVWHRAGGARETRSKAKEREAKQEHRHPDFRRDARPAAERTKGERTGSRGGTPHHHPQPAGGSRTPLPTAASQQRPDSARQPNAWFRGGPADEPGGFPRNSTGSAERPQAGGVDAERRRESAPNQQQGGRQPVRCLQRRWESCSAEPQPPGDSAVFDFSVMSYNILSQELLQDNAYLYRHCDPAVLPWQYRLPNLLAEIQQHDADVLCLQEVQEDHYENQIKPALQDLGYRCEYKKRTGKKPDGCAVIFKASRFSLVSSTPVEFLRRGDALLDRDNVGMVVLLEPRGAAPRSRPPAPVCVANTHLLYNPRRGDIKLAQLAILLAEIGRLSHLPDGRGAPVVLCGDFNSSPWSPLYRFLTTGCLEYRGMKTGMVSGQENSPKGHRLLTAPIWSGSLGISQRCRYESSRPDQPPAGSSTAVEGGMSSLTVDDPATNAAAAAISSARIEHNLKLRSSYRHRLAPDGRPEITTCHSRTALTVDYILYSSDVDATPSLPGGRGLQLLGRLSLVGQSELEEVSGLPNRHHSSDHLPLLASFRLRC